MIGLALALAAAAPNLAALDDAALALTTCEFAMVRKANGMGGGRERVAAALASGCTAEEARYRSLAIANHVARGQSRQVAAANVDRQLAEGRSDMIAEYVRFEAMGLFKPVP